MRLSNFIYNHSNHSTGAAAASHQSHSRHHQQTKIALKRSRQCHLAAVSLFAWGENSDGQLGIGGGSSGAVNRDSVNVPTRLPDDDSTVRAISGGDRHTLLLRQDGCVRVCGSDCFGQLGGAGGRSGGEDAGLQRFSQVTSLESKRIVCIAAGGCHSLAVDEDGQTYAWGRNQCGQLGRDDSTTTSANSSTSQNGFGGVRLVRQLSNHRVAQVAAGQAHSLIGKDQLSVMSV